MKDISVRGNQHIIIVTAVRNFHFVTDKFSFSNFFRFLNPASRITLQNGRTDGFRKRGSSYSSLILTIFPSGAIFTSNWNPLILNSAS